MMAMRWVAVIVCVGCGRIGFGTVTGDGAIAGGDGMIQTDDAGHQIVSLIVTTAGTGLWSFHSRENPAADLRPLLVLTLQ